MNRKTRIVCKPVEIPYTYHDGSIGTACVWQEVFTSPYKVDCQKWIDNKHNKGDFTVYRIFTEDN